MPLRSVFLPIVLVLSASCALDLSAITPDAGRARVDSGVGPRDGGGDAGPPFDTGTPVDTGIPRPPDAGPEVMDAGPPDVGPADAGPPDAGPPDAGPPDTGPRPSCDSLYSGAGRYYGCGETPTTCEFYTDPPGSQSCDTVCAAGGGTCLDAWREAYPCGHLEDRTCGFPMNDMICLCTR